MTGFAFPEVLMAMVQAMNDENSETIMALYRTFLPLIAFEQQPGIAIRKEIFRLRGLISNNSVRHPGTPLNLAAAAQLTELLDELLPGCDLTKRLDPFAFID
jgi:4-hydroxy-tetrahydrodipicolinate synthase